jgi:hypothetical protein
MLKEVLARYYALPSSSPEKMRGFMTYLGNTCCNCYAMRSQHFEDKCLFQGTHFESPSDAVKRMAQYVDTYPTMSGLKNMTLEHSQEFWGSEI